jgi:heptosyltransferase-2
MFQSKKYFTPGGRLPHPLASPIPAGSRYRYAKRRYRLLFGVLDGFFGPAFRFGRAMTQPRRAIEPRSIVIVQLDHIGDAVLSTPMLRTLRKRFPAASIDVVASQSNREIFETNPHLRYVHVSACNWLARRAGRQQYFGEAFRLARLLRRFRYDLGIDPRGDFLATVALWLAGIPRRLGWACGGGGFLLTDSAPWDATRHEVESRGALVESLGILASHTRPELFPSWSDTYHVRELLAAVPELRPPLLVLHIAAGTKAKRWPARHWGELLERLSRERFGSVILVGDSADQSLCRSLLHASPRAIDWTGRLTLMQLAALLDEADLFIGCDSGPAHIAAAMGTPSVLLFSATNRVESWRPVEPDVHVLRNIVPCSPCHQKVCPVAGHPCMSGISPAAVVELAQQIVSTSSRRPQCGEVVTMLNWRADLRASAD